MITPQTLTGFKSSNVAGATYDPATHNLTVKFNSGGAYRYQGVTPKTWSEFQSAPSKGGFVASRLRHIHQVAKV